VRDEHSGNLELSLAHRATTLSCDGVSFAPTAIARWIYAGMH
jgi:hypothetical protein